MSQPWRPRHKAENPWVSHTVAAHKAAGILPPYANRYHTNNDFYDYNSNNNRTNMRYSAININIKLNELKETIEEIKRGENTSLYLAGLGLTDLSDIPGVMDVLHLITSLSCSFNPITDLPNLRKKAPKLEFLQCNYTSITELPPLPDSLIFLNCASCGTTGYPMITHTTSNGLRRLPRPLPPKLGHLICSSNSLIYLPPLPPTISQLIAENNQLKELPQLPNSLRTLYINNNQIVSIPKLPPNLIYMKAFENPLGPPFNQPPLNILLTKPFLLTDDLTIIRPIINNYWDHHTVETLGAEMVNPESHLSAGTGKRTGYGFPVGPNVSLLEYLKISNPQNKKSFNQTRANLRTKVNPNPLSNVNATLFKGGIRRNKRSKYTRRR